MQENTDYLSESDEALRHHDIGIRVSRGCIHRIRGLGSSENFINQSYFLGTCLDFLGKIAYCKIR